MKNQQHKELRRKNRILYNTFTKETPMIINHIKEILSEGRDPNASIGSILATHRENIFINPIRDVYYSNDCYTRLEKLREFINVWEPVFTPII